MGHGVSKRAIGERIEATAGSRALKADKATPFFLERVCFATTMHCERQG